jgi:predicted ATP-grasp superfamily ATP-dependent carboligase
MRTLRPWGVRVYTLASAEPSIPNASRFCAGTFAIGRAGRPVGKPEEAILDDLLDAGRRLGGGALLLAGSDEWSVFVAAHAHALATEFCFPTQPPELVQGLASKRGLHELARCHGLPSPRILVPADEHELARAADELQFPVMLKPILSRPGLQGLELVKHREELLPRFRGMGDPGNVLCQEYIPGGDEDVWVFNGYFDGSSRCLAAFTGRKIRQYPAQMGLISLGVCEHNVEVIELTQRFLAAVRYRGVVDIGYRWDRRDGQYKVLDINPRLGGAFRLFVDMNGMDVVRAMYLDLTGRAVPGLMPKDGRKWMLEAAEILAHRHYRRNGMGVLAWLRSLRGLEEGATFSLSDPAPFLTAMRILAGDTLSARARGVAARLHPGKGAPSLPSPLAEEGPAATATESGSHATERRLEAALGSPGGAQVDLAVRTREGRNGRQSL